MLDTNLLVDFLLIQWKEDNKAKLPKLLEKSKELKDAYLENKFVNYASEWNLLELRDVIEKITEEKKLIEYGYAIHEFSEGRKELGLTAEEIATIEKSVETISKKTTVKTEEMDLNVLRKLTNLGVSTFDCIHLMQANQIRECNYFVTRDSRLIGVFIEKLSEKLPNIRAIRREEALRIINAT